MRGRDRRRDGERMLEKEYSEGGIEGREELCEGGKEGGREDVRERKIVGKG